MRLHHLTLTGFGPFKDRQEIDFDDLASSELFLIEGATGAGKTTIIDGVVYALYGTVSAGDQDTTRQRVRSMFCTETDPTGVACEFSVDGRRYRITRVPSDARDPEDPSRAPRRQPQQVLTEEVLDGEPIIRTNRQEIAQRITELLGMSVDQFRQLVVLPQGRFAELLRHTPADRLKSLEPLLENGLVAAIQADLEQRGLDAKRASAEADARVLATAEQLRGRLAAWLEEMPPEVEFTDANVPDDIRCARVADILAALQAEAERTQTARDEQSLIVESRRGAAREAADAWALLDAVASATAATVRARAAADAEDADLDEPAARSRLTHLHQLIGSLQTHAAWEQQADARAAEIDALEGQVTQLREAVARLTDQARPLPAEIERLEAERAAAVELAAQAASSGAEVARLTALREKALGLEQCRLDESRLASAAERAAAELTSAEEADGAAETALLTLLHEQRAAAAVLLAGRLVEHEPCPVCGSVDHPHPAAPVPGAETVAEEDIEAAQRRLDAARDTTTQAEKSARVAQAAHQAKVQELAALEGALGSLDLPTVVAQLEDATLRSAAATAAAATAADLDAELAATRQRAEEIRARLESTTNAITELESTLAAKVAHEEQRLTEIAQHTAGAGTATEVLAVAQARSERLQALAEALGALTATTARVPADLAGVSPADAQERAAERAADLSAAEELLAHLTEQAATAAAIHDESLPLADHLRTAVAERATIAEDTKEALRLAALVRSDNQYRLQLRSYALQQRFVSVLESASVHLERMSGGRFSFIPSFETARSGQSGLGVTVMDSWSGQPQDPKALSGGETFYASLALALGLADVVRNDVHGSALETLFVDEGFGSLDQDTLAQVLDELDGLRAGNRVVGVVSHVTEMKESIPERIEVRRQADRTSVIHRDRS